MSTRLELEDLPPRYRAQAEKQIADRRARKAPEGAVSLEVAAKTAGEIGKVFESKGEYDFYIGTVLPGIQSGRIIKATPHVAFPCCPQRISALSISRRQGIRRIMCWNMPTERWKWWKLSQNSPGGRRGTTSTAAGCLLT